MKRDNKYAIAAVIGAILLWASTGGIFSNCRGIFFNPVSTSLGVSLSAMNLAGILSGIVSAAAMPLCAKIYHGPKGRPFLTVTALAFCAAQYLLGYTTSLAWFYCASLVQGVTAGFINMYVIQAIASAWYPNRKGTILGIISLSPSITGIIMNPMITSWIEGFGWQAAYRMTGITVTVLVVTTLIILRPEPAMAGCKPITGKSAPVAAAADPTQASMLHVVLALVCVCVIALLNALAQHLANYAILAGRGAIFGAAMVSCTMIGSTIAKFIMGPANDRAGARATTLVAGVLVIVACVGLIFTDSDIVMYGCSLLIGLLLALSALEIPLICRSAMTPAMYRRYFPRITSVNILLSSSSAGILSFLLGINGSYTPVLLFSMGLVSLLCLCVVILGVLHRRQAAAE